MPGPLAQRWRAKYPGSYDDLDDATLERMILKKYPGSYDDLVSPETKSTTEAAKPEEGKSHGWLADTAYNFGKRFADIPHSLYETTQPAGFAKGTQELAELRKDPHALDAKMAQYKKDFESNLSSPGAWAKSALGEIDPTGTLPGYVDLAGQFAEDFRGKNVGGMGADAVLAALPFLIPSALRGIKKLRGVSTAGIDAAALPKGPSPYDVQRPPSPYDVERPPSPYDVPKVSPFNVERPPSPYDVPRPDYNVDRGIPPTNVPMPQTRMLPEPGAQGSFIRGPRTARPEPNLLGPAQPYTGPRFMGSDIGQPAIDVTNPENLSTQGFPIDQTQAALGVTEPTRPFQPGIPKTVEGRVIPRQGAGRVFSPDYPAPITPEVLAPEPAPPVQPIQQPAAPVLAGTKVVPVPKPKAVVEPGSVQSIKARVAELKKLAKEQARLAKQTQSAQPQVQVVPPVEPVPVPEMQALPEVKPIEPTPVPQVEPIVEPTPAPVKVKKAKLPKPVVEPITEPVAEAPASTEGKYVPTSAEAQILYEDLEGAKSRYKTAFRDYRKFKTPLMLERLNKSINELKAATEAKRTGKLRGTVEPKPAVEPVTEPVKQELPAVEPIAEPTREIPDLTNKSIPELRDIATTADEATGNAIREEFTRRRNAAAKGGTLGSGFGSLQDAPRLLKQEFDEWRVLRELPENQAAFEEFLKDTGRAALLANLDKPVPGERGELQSFEMPHDSRSFKATQVGELINVIRKTGVPELDAQLTRMKEIVNAPEMSVEALQEFRELGHSVSRNPAMPEGFRQAWRRASPLHPGEVSKLEPTTDTADFIKRYSNKLPEVDTSVVPKKQLFAEENDKIREAWNPDKFHVEIVGKSGKTVTPFEAEFETREAAENYIKRVGVDGLRIAWKPTDLPKLDTSVVKEPELSPVVKSRMEHSEAALRLMGAESDVKYKKPTPRSEVNFPKISEPIVSGDDYYKSLSTRELAEAARLADNPEAVAKLRKEVERRRARTGVTIHSGGLGEASSILKKEFDAWRVLRKLPENQEAFDLFLLDTGRYSGMVIKHGKVETQDWGGTQKTAKIGEGLKRSEVENKPLGSLDYQDLPSAEKPVGRTQSNINRGEGYYEKAAQRKGNKLEYEPKPAGITERFTYPKGEKFAFKEGGEVPLKDILKRQADEAKTAAEQAAAERAMAKEKADVAAQKEADRTAAKESRQAERQAKIDARKQKIADKKAAEIPPAELTGELGETTVQKARWGKFMKANPAFKAITDKLIKTRSADRLIGKKLRDQFKDIADIPKEKIIQFQEALAKGHYPEVRKFFDDMHADLTSKGIEMGEKENYLPQLWDNTAKEVRAAFGDKKMSEKASFQFRSFIEDYKTGIEDKGLTPKMSPIQLIEWYGKRANKLLADSTALKELKAQGYLRTKKLPGMQAMDENLGTFKYHYAEPAVKKVLENYLKSSDTQSGFGHAVAKGVGKVSSSILSAGVPKVPLLTFHGGGMTVRSLFEGGPRRVGQAIKFGLSPKRAAAYIDANIDKMISRTQEFGANFGTESAPGQGEKFFTKEGGSFGRGTAKKAFNWLNDKQMELFEKPLFDKMLPALKHTAWEDNFAKFQKKGMDRAKAGAAATEVTDAFFSGKNVDLLYNDKNFNTAVRVLTLAPNWLRSTIDLGIKVPSSVVKILKDPSNPVTRKYLKAGATLAGTYAAANILQKATTGKFMVENSNADIFNFQLGKDANGKPRSFKLFGTAGDFAKVPLQIAMAGFKEGGWLEAAEGAIENRVSPLVQALISAKTGEDYQGNPNLFRTKDDFGRPIPIKERAKNTLSQLAGFGPAQISAPINYMLGKAGAEETLAKLTETALKYGKKKKVKPGAFGGPNLSGLSSIK